MTQRTNTFTIFFLVALMLMFVEGFLFGNGNIFFAFFGVLGVIFAMKKKKRTIFWISAGIIVLVLISMWSMRLIVLAILGYVIFKMMRKEPVEFDFSSYKELLELFSANGWTFVTAISMMIMCVLHYPCSTTCLTIKKETGSLKTTLLSMIIPTMIGIFLCMLVANTARIL